MKILSRISATLAAGASDTLARFENHEAIGAAAIERCRRAVAAARLGERQHQRAAERFTDRRATAMADVESWSARAAEHAHSDDRTALACLERKHQAAQVLEHLDEEILRHTNSGHAIARRVRELESRLDTVTRQHATLSSRATAARADAAMAAVDTSADGIEDVFDRWESTVDVAEMRTEHNNKRHLDTVEADPLATRLEQEERQQTLAAELEELKRATRTGGAS